MQRYKGKIQNILLHCHSFGSHVFSDELLYLIMSECLNTHLTVHVHNDYCVGAVTDHKLLWVLW